MSSTIVQHFLNIREKTLSGNYATGENIWYHGSNKEFDHFEHRGRAWEDKAMPKSSGKAPGIFFTESRQFVALYLKQQFMELMPHLPMYFYIYTVKFNRDINLMDMRDEEDVAKFLEKIQDKSFSFSKFRRTPDKPTNYEKTLTNEQAMAGLKSLEWPYTENQVFADVCQDMGYDGVVIKIAGDISCYIFDPTLVTIVKKEPILSRQMDQIENWFVKGEELYDPNVGSEVRAHKKKQKEKAAAEALKIGEALGTEVGSKNIFQKILGFLSNKKISESGLPGLS